MCVLDKPAFHYNNLRLSTHQGNRVIDRQKLQQNTSWHDNLMGVSQYLTINLYIKESQNIIDKD